MRLVSSNNNVNSRLSRPLRLQQANSAASSMMLQLQIPENNHLAFVLEQHQARSNKEAICGWLFVQNRDQPINQESYTRLLERLRKKLNALDTEIY